MVDHQLVPLAIDVQAPWPDIVWLRVTAQRAPRICSYATLAQLAVCARIGSLCSIDVILIDGCSSSDLTLLWTFDNGARCMPTFGRPRRSILSKKHLHVRDAVPSAVLRISTARSVVPLALCSLPFNRARSPIASRSSLDNPTICSPCSSSARWISPQARLYFACRLHSVVRTHASSLLRPPIPFLLRVTVALSRLVHHALFSLVSQPFAFSRCRNPDLAIAVQTRPTRSHCAPGEGCGPYGARPIRHFKGVCGSTILSRSPAFAAFGFYRVACSIVI